MAPKSKKAAAPPAAPAAPAMPAAKPAGPKLDTLADMKLFVKIHEAKMDDAREEASTEPNRAKKKELENVVKNLETNEYYVKAKQGVIDKELEAKKAAEKASIAGSQPDPKKSVSVAERKEGGSIEELSEAEISEIASAFEGSGKDAAAAKAAAIAKIQGNANASSFMFPLVNHLVPLYADSKLGDPAIKATTCIVESANPKGHGIADCIMPVLIRGMEDKKWKVKKGCIQVVGFCVKEMAAETPGQLGECLPQIVSKLADAALEVRAEVRTATTEVLRVIGSLVESPEIKRLSPDLVTALAEPTNQKHTQAVLAKMGNQTFMSLIDAASMSLITPVLVRGLKEREAMSKKWSAQIFGSTAQLAVDIEIIRPCVKQVMPLLQTCLMDTVVEVQRESAKVFGTFEKTMPEYSRTVTMPWLFECLRSGDTCKQTAAASAIAEVFVCMNPAYAAKLVPEIEIGCTDASWSVRRGFMELMDTMPQAMKMEFHPYIKSLFPTMLMSINGDADPTADPALRASIALVARFGDLSPDSLLPAFEGTFAMTLQSNTQDEKKNQIVREKSVTLLAQVADKILEHKKFGQDLHTTDGCAGATLDTREYLLSLNYVMRCDPDAGVKRVANSMWRNVGGKPKMANTIKPVLARLLQRFASGDMGDGAQKLAKAVWEELGEDVPDEGHDPKKFVFPPVVPESARFDRECALIVKGKPPDSESDGTGVDIQSANGHHASQQAAMAQDSILANADFLKLPADTTRHCGVIAKSIVQEGRRKKKSGPVIAAELAEKLRITVTLAGNNDEIINNIPAHATAAVRAALGNSFDSVTTGGADDKDTLLYCENLLLMYGAGHLLLKDTLLEMKKNSRYGVVGHNGAGKTTLMKEIVAHRIVGMPADVKCVHVDDSKLGEMSKSSLTALEYCVKMAKEIGAGNASQKTLIDVGFEEARLGEPVSDLSTGWRMRLTLAVSMLKHADLVLLDEPTNHLDEQSVDWLAEYILSITQSSVMVISHEPKFLNKICTHIIAYVDKKLEYTVGDFNAFAAKKGLSKEQIDAMLSGNLNFDTEEADDGEDGAKKESVVKAGGPPAGPPKLSFPIPGKMEGMNGGGKPVVELKQVSFRFSRDKDYLFGRVDGKLSLSSRVAICGRNGCGKSTLMTLLCSELSPSENVDGKYGEVWRHCNLRLAYMKQDHLKALGPFFDTSPFVYITERFKDGYDGDLQKRLIEPEDDEEAARRAKLAKEHGKYGNEVEDLLVRSKQGATLVYEVKWAGLDDPKQNTIEPISKLKKMGLDKVIIACDERLAAKAAGLDNRPLTRREISKHCEAFGIDGEMCCNRQIRGFSAGQKVRLSLAAMFWTKPHLIALDEPTNYLDVETVEALVKALITFRGGIVMIEPKTDFVERICNERWNIDDARVTVEKMNTDNKRQA